MPIHKRLFIILSTVVFSLSSAWGDDKKAATKTAKETPAKNGGSDLGKLLSGIAGDQAASTKITALKDSCEKKAKEITDNFKKYQDACKNKPKLSAKRIQEITKKNNSEDDDEEDENDDKSSSARGGGASCVEVIATCEQANAATESRQDDEESKSAKKDDPIERYANQFVNSLGNYAGVDLSNLQTEKKAKVYAYLCPAFSKDDYNQQKKDLESELKDSKRDLEQAKKDLLEKKKENQENLERLNKEVKEAKEKFEKNNKDKNSAVSQMEKKMLEFSRKKLDEESMLNKQRTALNTKRSQIDDTYIATLQKFNSVAISKTCDREYQKIADSVLGTNKQNQQGLIKARKTSSFNALSIYKMNVNTVKSNDFSSCMKEMRIQKEASMRSLERQQAELDAEFNDLRVKEANMLDSYRENQKEVATFKNQNTKELSEDKIKYIQELGELRTKIMQAQEYAKNVQQQYEEKIKNVEKEAKETKRKMDQMGPRPKVKEGEVDYADALMAYRQAHAAHTQMKTECNSPETRGIIPNIKFEEVDLNKTEKKIEKVQQETGATAQ